MGAVNQWAVSTLGNFNLKGAITVSCNTYFANVMQRTINNPAYGSVDSSLKVWDSYMYAFGLGHKLGIDIPTEKSGSIPTPKLIIKFMEKAIGIFALFVQLV